MEETLRLGSLDDPAAIAEFSDVVQLADGRIIAAGPASAGQLLVFGADGAFRRSIERTGEGPGEFLAPFRMRPTADGGLAILDSGTLRISLLSPQLDFRGSVRITDILPMDFTILEGGGDDVGAFHAVHGVEEGGRASGLIVGEDGNVVARLPEAGGEPRGPDVINFFRAPLTVDGEGDLWLARSSGYGIERWSREGGRLGVLSGEPEWFKTGPPADGIPFPSVLYGLDFDDGLLWIATLVADAEFEEAMRSLMAAGNNPGMADYNRLVDTIIEVVNHDTGELLARVRHDQMLKRTGDGRHYVALQLQNDLIPQAVLYRPALSRP